MGKRKEGLQPFLKWTGGKRWAVKDLENLIPESYGRYFEPFLGGGALFFHLKPYPATLTDTNRELINTYRQVRDECEQVVSRLQRLPICREQFLKIRKSRPRTNINKAVRFLFLNRTAYNGMFRVNQRGEFNVPFGCKEGTRLCDPNHFRMISKALQNRSIRVSDFEAIIDLAESGDVVYADPPYTTQHNNNGFRRYNENLFTWADQIRLADACSRASARGAHVIISNADHFEIRALYKNLNSLVKHRYSSIGSTSTCRGPVAERIFFSSTIGSG